MTETVTLNRANVRQVLEALTGPDHHIRELQYTMSLPGNPIVALVAEFNATTIPGDAMSTYTFDVTLTANFTVAAPNEGMARRILRESVDGNEANFGAWPDGSPVLAEVGIENIDLGTVEGEAP